MSGQGPIDANEQPELPWTACVSISHIEHTELDRPKVHSPAVVVHFFEADEFSGEAVTEIPLRLAKGNDAVRIHALDLRMRRIRWVWESTGVWSQRRGILRGWRVVAQGLVRPLVIVFLTKRLEAAPLRAPAAARRPRRFCLQRTVHPLMAAVLIRSPGQNPLRTNAQTNPPDGSPR